MSVESHPEIFTGLKNVKQRTAYVLETSPGTKGDDRSLTLIYHLKFNGWAKYLKPMTKEEFNEFMQTVRHSTADETITRCRRKLNEMGLYQPLMRTRVKRAVREAAIRENIGDL